MINNHMLRIGALFLLTVLSYGFYNAYLPITDPVESNYVLSAITMLKHNSWISPMIYDHVWYDKPPLTYWALMITYKLFGISDFTSRIPNTLVAGVLSAPVKMASAPLIPWILALPLVLLWAWHRRPMWTTVSCFLWVRRPFLWDIWIKK